MMQPVHDSTSDPAPYPPSWFDRFSDWVDGQRFPQWAFYAALTMLSAVGLILFQAIQGAYPDGVINPWHAFFAVQPVFFLGLMHYLDHAAASALDRFRPALAGGEDEYRAARYRLTTLPAQSVRRATLAGILAFLLLLGPTTFQVDSSPFRLAINTTTLQVFDMSTRPATGWVMLAVYLGLWGVIGVLVLHTAHQLREVRRLYAGVKATDPFQPEPLYAFSPVTSLTALLLLLNSYGWMLLLLTGSQATAGGYSLTGGVMVNVFFAALSVFLFVWPVWGAHHLLEGAKKGALAGNAGHFKTLAARLHGAIERAELDGVKDWQAALGALELERQRLERLPTWPWRPEASRGLLAALIVPILIWLLQFGLEKLLG